MSNSKTSPDLSYLLVQSNGAGGVSATYHQRTRIDNSVSQVKDLYVQKSDLYRLGGQPLLDELCAHLSMEEPFVNFPETFIVNIDSDEGIIRYLYLPNISNTGEKLRVFLEMESDCPYFSVVAGLLTAVGSEKIKTE